MVRALLRASLHPALLMFCLATRSVLAAPPDWSSWAYHVNLEVQDTASVALPAGYTVRAALDTARLIGQGRMRADCADLRVSVREGSTESELDRLVTGCNTASTSVTLRTQTEIPTGAFDTSYRLHWGNASAINPPGDPRKVYVFYDDFQDGNAIGWAPAEGKWAVVADGGNDVYRYLGEGSRWVLSSVDLPGISDLDLSARVRVAGSPLTTTVGLAFRIRDPRNFLSLYANRSPDRFHLARIEADNHTIFQLPSFPIPIDTWHRIRLQATGARIRTKIWREDAPEPAAWIMDVLEDAYESMTGIGATVYGSTYASADWDDVRVSRLVSSEPVVSLQWDSAAWWNAAWGYRARLRAANSSSTTSLPARYSMRFTLDTSALISQGKLLASCDDLRIVSFDGTSSVEIDRVVEGCGGSSAEVWFALQRPLSPLASDSDYYVYYGNRSTGAPPSDGMRVFIFYESWEQGTAHWTGAGGLDPARSGTMGQSAITTEKSFSPRHSQKFKAKTASATAFSGLIPVGPATGYAVQVWGRSATSAYGPVGYDLYDSQRVKRPGALLWTNEWTPGPEWSGRSAALTTAADSAYLKIKSHWWNQSEGGTQTLYLDDVALRYAIADEPVLSEALEQTILPSPTITEVQDTGPVAVQTPLTVYARVSSSEGTIQAVKLDVLSPEAAGVTMTLVSGDDVRGVWKGTFTPARGGLYTYRIFARSASGRSSFTDTRSFTSEDTQAPQLTLVGVNDPLLVRTLQTLIVRVTDNGLVDQVAVSADGTIVPMIRNGDEYLASWRVSRVGAVGFTVTAIDTVGNRASLPGTFQSLAREVEVCAWRGCKRGAASFSIDDGRTNCRAEMEAAGFRGTYYYNGIDTLPWFSTYSAAGHEIGAHTTDHLCPAPCCYSTCTQEGLSQCPYAPAEVSAYRRDQLDPNISAIEAGTGVPVTSMAWPCGAADPARMMASSFYVLGVRGFFDNTANLYWIQNANDASPDEFMNLKAYNTFTPYFIDKAINEGKWTIITSHGSCAAVSHMGSRGDALWLAPVGEVLKYIRVRDAASVTNYGRAGLSISFDVTHGLPALERRRQDGTPLLGVVFDNPVTIKVKLKDADVVRGVAIDGGPAPYTVQRIDDVPYALVECSLEVTRRVSVRLNEPPPTIAQIADSGPVEYGSSARITAKIDVPNGSVGTASLRVLSPEVASTPMSLVAGTADVYAASFTPGLILDHTYRVLATNGEGDLSQSPPQTFAVRDTTPPSWRGQSQTQDTVLAGQRTSLKAEGMDIGGLRRATLLTDEGGAWQEFRSSDPTWWNEDWAYRRPVTVRETAGSSRSNETVDLFVSATEFPGLTGCASELRVADANRNEIPVQTYEERTLGGVLSCHLLFQVSVEANASRTYHVYFGNPWASPPSYATDLVSSAGAGSMIVRNSFFDLNVDTSGGVVSRVRLPGRSGTDLPLAPPSDYYWGWHQVCSSVDGNITGKNQFCGNGARASGLAFAATLEGPIVKEFTFSAVKGPATYAISFRFFANAPYYRYTLTTTGTSALVMNNFWYVDGAFARLGKGSGGTPPGVYNTYTFGADQVRLASFEKLNLASIDGVNNDGTTLGGSSYNHPWATGLALQVATAATQQEADEALRRLASPVTMVLGAVEQKPQGPYGSPFEAGGSTVWTPTVFFWQNPGIPVGRLVNWRVRFCDLRGNCRLTDARAFRVVDTPPLAGSP